MTPLRVEGWGPQARRFATRHCVGRIAAVFERSLHIEANGDFLCLGGECRAAPDPRDSEPNDTVANAQSLFGLALPLRLFGELRPNGTTPDRDVFKLRVEAGVRLAVTTRAVCGVGAPRLDTDVQVFKDGVLVADAAFAEIYGRVTFTAVTAGDYVIEVRDEAFGGVKTGAYVLTIEPL